MHYLVRLASVVRMQLDLTWTLADRLSKSRRAARLSVTEMAEKLDVHRNTISGWESGRHRPRRRDITAWSLVTGAPVTWLNEVTGGYQGWVAA